MGRPRPNTGRCQQAPRRRQRATGTRSPGRAIESTCSASSGGVDHVLRDEFLPPTEAAELRLQELGEQPLPRPAKGRPAPADAEVDPDVLGVRLRLGRVVRGLYVPPRRQGEPASAAPPGRDARSALGLAVCRHERLRALQPRVVLEPVDPPAEQRSAARPFACGRRRGRIAHHRRALGVTLANPVAIGANATICGIGAQAIAQLCQFGRATAHPAPRPASQSAASARPPDRRRPSSGSTGIASHSTRRHP